MAESRSEILRTGGAPHTDQAIAHAERRRRVQMRRLLACAMAANLWEASATDVPRRAFEFADLTVDRMLLSERGAPNSETSVALQEDLDA